jgi:molybdate transport system substrate-binding protein
MRWPIILAALAGGAWPTTTAAETVQLHAAGSLKAALGEVVVAFQARHPGAKVEPHFGASGLLRERIEKGEPAHVFASADIGHPAKLAEAGRAQGKVAIFARNQICALAREGLKVTSQTLLDAMLSKDVRVATSTPKADPSGDYAFALFAKTEQQRSGARAVLEAKALQLTGGPTSAKAPDGKNLYGWVMASGQADVFLTYCTNAVLAQKEVPMLQVVSVPPELSVAADYGLVVLKTAPPAALALESFILGPDGQAILVKHGFGRGDSLAR